MSLSREEIIRIAIGTARENGHFRRCFLTDQDLEKIADIAYAAGAAAEREAALTKSISEVSSRYVPVALVSEEFGSDTHYIETIDKKMRIPEGTKLFMDVKE